MPVFDQAYLYGAIKRRLAVSSVNVELKDQDIATAINAACQLMARYVPQKAYNVIPVSITSNNKTLMPAANFPGIIGVDNVEFFNSSARLDRFPYPDSYADQFLILGNIKDMQKMYSDYPRWEYGAEIIPGSNPPVEGFYLYTYLTQDSYVDRYGRLPTYACIRYNWAIDPTVGGDPRIGLSRVPMQMREWVERYSTEMSREIMGQARGKFLGVMGPGENQVIGVDDARQLGLASDRLQKLEDDLKSRQSQNYFTLD